MSTMSALALISRPNTNAKRLFLGSIVTLQDNCNVEEETSLGLASPLSVLVENKTEILIGLAGPLSVLVENKQETLMGVAQPLAALVENTLDKMIIT